jgi:DNA (cytosine-5)-methyltransferase 1
MGYHRAGFEVVGVDIKNQPNYPFRFHQADALEFARGIGRDFDAIHASPPCQAYSTATLDPSKHPDLYAPTVDLLCRIGKPWVVENVIGAPYNSGIVLCGTMFGLRVQRHRNFETSFLIMQPPHHHPKGRERPITITGSGSSNWQDYKHSRKAPVAMWPELMGMPWATWKEVRLAIPPAYTQWIGVHLLAALSQDVLSAPIPAENKELDSETSSKSQNSGLRVDEESGK